MAPVVDPVLVVTVRPLPCHGHRHRYHNRNEQDALKESFPDMPREDRQLLMLRFVREVDQSVDYGEVRSSPIDGRARLLVDWFTV